jgi:uncharacterized protein YggE
MRKDVKSMKRSGIIGGLMAAAALTLLAGLAFGPGNRPAAAQTGDIIQPTVNVSGEGRVSAKPDMAIVSAGVSARGSSVAEAMDQANQAIDRVRASLQANGIAERDIQTSSISVSPQYSRSTGPDAPPQIVGYQASQQLQIRIRDINAIGKVIDDAAAAGGDLFTLSGLRFTIADPTSLQSQAREQAMAKARAKAEELARLGGLTLGSPIAINEGAEPPTPVLIARSTEFAAPAAAPAPTGVSAGELEIVVTVQVSYAAR